MSKILTTDKLVTSVKRRGMLPSDQITFTKQDIIDILNEEMDIGVLPHLLSSHEEYLVNYTDQTMSAGVRGYSIPYRAIGNKLRSALLVDANGNTTDMTRVELEDVEDSQNLTYAFYVQNNQLIILGNIPSTVQSLRMHYYLRPSELVENKYAATVTNINTATGEVAVDQIPSNFQTSALYDFTGAKTPNKLFTYDIATVAINTTSKIMTFSTDDLPAELGVGDYITINEESIAPQVPTELHPLLAQRAAVHCIEALGDMQGLQLAQRKLKEMEAATINLIENRVESAPQKINNTRGPLGQTKRWHGYRRRF